MKLQVLNTTMFRMIVSGPDELFQVEPNTVSVVVQKHHGVQLRYAGSKTQSEVFPRYQFAHLVYAVMCKRITEERIAIMLGMKRTAVVYMLKRHLEFFNKETMIAKMYRESYVKILETMGFTVELKRVR